MIVNFKNTFHVQGFGRSRFKKGLVRDVPESLRDLLPSSAKIMDDDFPDAADQVREADELKAADLLRARTEGTDHEALVAAGMAGFASESDPVDDEPTVEDAPAKAPRTTRKEK